MSLMVILAAGTHAESGPIIRVERGQHPEIGLGDSEPKMLRCSATQRESTAGAAALEIEPAWDVDP